MRKKNNNSQALELVHEDTTGDMIFAIGVLLSLLARYKAENELTQTPKPPSQGESTSTLNNSAVINSKAQWVYLIAILFLTDAAFKRLNLQPSAANAEKADNILKGREIVAIGDIVKIIAFTMTAIGNQIIADNSQ